MKKTGFLLFVLWFLSVPALAGDVIVKLQVLQPSLVLGEPLSVVITVENTSQSALDLPFEPILAGMNPAILVGTPGGQALTSSHGAPLACEEAHTNITASFPWKMGKDFDITVPAGKSVEFHSRLWLPISLRTKPGIYTLTPHYVARGTHPGQLGAVIGGPAPHPARQVGQGCWKGTVDGTAVQINLKAPTGMDAQAYQAFKGHPLKHPAELLKRFPTSTYAGYALMKMGPGGYLPDSEKWVTMTPRQRDIAWAVPLGATAEKQDAHRRQRRDNLSAFVSEARTFLSLHPDFARADILRKEMANALFQLNQRDAAIEQVEKLSKMKGPVANEAQAVMTQIKKASPKSK